MWVEPLLNEEAPEPFSLLSKSTLLSANEREKESAPFGVFQSSLRSFFLSPAFWHPARGGLRERGLEWTHNGEKCLWQLGRCAADGGRG